MFAFVKMKRFVADLFFFFSSIALRSGEFIRDGNGLQVSLNHVVTKILWSNISAVVGRVDLFFIFHVQATVVNKQTDVIKMFALSNGNTENLQKPSRFQCILVQFSAFSVCNMRCDIHDYL